MPFVRAADLVVHYEFSGVPGAPVVLLSNALGTSTHLWDEQVPALGKRFRVLRYDTRGHGLTERTVDDAPWAARVERLADDVAALLDALALVRVHFVGLSLGGLVGQRFAAAYPQRIRKLVLCATATRIPGNWDERMAMVRRDGMTACAAALSQRWFSAATRAARPDLVRGFVTMLSRTSSEGYAAGCAAVRDADLRAGDANITAPALVISGAQDVATTPEMGAELRDAIPGARQLVFDDAAHFLCAEQPALLNDALLDFLED